MPLDDGFILVLGVSGILDARGVTKRSPLGAGSSILRA